ncbi:MAG: hypothetical protein WC378_12325 [Opitutaceae bacterium]|jgi:hypothetical protein
MSETKNVKVRLHDGMIKECAIALSGGPPWKLPFSGIELGTQEFSGEDLFEALNALRGALEKIGGQLLCAGARPDVFPSGMSRGMGGGRKAYITRIGAPALRTDLVDIFDYAGPELVGTVAQQKAFHEKWAESFRQ